MPIRTHSGPAVRSLLAATVVAMLCLGPHAAAAECADGEDVGICLDDSTFQWCEDGELKTVNCPTGQFCVDDNPWYDGAGCLATDKTDCEDIPPQGECTTANSVVWCDAGTPRVHECDEDSVCGWDDVTDWYDCLPAGNSSHFASADAASEDASDASSDEFGSGDATDGEEADDVGPNADGAAPNPTVTVGAEDTESNPSSTPSSGCAGGGTPHSWWWAILCLLGLSCRRRECSVTTA